MKPEILQFDIYGLFNEFEHHHLDFQNKMTQVGEARVVIMTGHNGTGKTTILNMIHGILNLDFDFFRRIPFEKACLKLSTSDEIHVINNEGFLLVKFNESAAKLSKKSSGALDETNMADVDKFRSLALPILKEVSFEKVDIHRSNALRKQKEEFSPELVMDDYGQRIFVERHHIGKLRKSGEEKSFLSHRVRRFMREAQVDYKKYFSSEGPALFPKILKRLTSPISPIQATESLISRLEVIKANESEMSRFGLSMNISDIDQLTDLLKTDDADPQNPSVNAALEAYIETLETKNEERKLISSRLKNFEELISKFIEGKIIQIDYEEGLKIMTSAKGEITELELSSGEYHLLYMMVTALVSTRTGTAIAIDEPELSLHITWQREIIKTLSACSSGASPLLIFATHSSAIASEFSDKCIDLQ